MKTVNVKLKLPDELAQKAKAADLLSPEALEALLHQEIRRREPDSAVPRKRIPLTQLIGAGKRHFSSPEEVDRFINEERDSWES